MLPAADCPVPLESRRVVSLPGLGCLAENTGKDCGSMLKPYLEAGKITGTQGLRGEIRVDPWCDSAEALCRLKRLYFEAVSYTHLDVYKRQALNSHYLPFPRI